MFKAPNIRGPRFRKDHKTVLTKKLFEKFTASHPQYSNLSLTAFKNIIRSNSRKMAEVATTERDGVALPIGGTVFVGSTKIRVKNNYDIQASIKANAPIKHRNYDTDGHVAKIYYSPYLSKVAGRDRSMWSFTGHRDFRRSLSKEYPLNWKRYIVVSDLYTVAKDYQRHKNRHYYEGSTAKATETYNEFDLT